MYKDYESPLQALSQNWVSVMLSDFVGTLVEYSHHNLKFPSKCATQTPIRIKSPISVNAGYSVQVKKDTVRIYAAHIGDQGFPDEYDVTIPRVHHDPRHWQLKKGSYLDMFRTFLRKVYTKSIREETLHFTTEVCGRPDEVKTVQVNLMSFVNTVVDLLMSNKEFTMDFHRNRWVIAIPKESSFERKTWFTNGIVSQVGKGNKGNNSLVRREAKKIAEMESAP